MTRQDKHLGPPKDHKKGHPGRLRELKATLDKHQKNTTKTKKGLRDGMGDYISAYHENNWFVDGATSVLTSKLVAVMFATHSLPDG